MNAGELLEFFDAPAALSFDLPPEQAISYFRAKGLRPTFAWQDMLGEEHATSFTVAKMMDTDLLADVQESLAQALQNGETFTAWADNLVPLLQAKGWWGRKEVLDPITGRPLVAQLGSPARLKTIFRTNMASAYAAGSWQQIQEQADGAPFLLYDAVDDYRTRPEHAAWDGRVYPIDDKFWRDHYPPNGWNCRCSVIQLSDDDVESLGLEVSKSRPGGTYKWTNPRTGDVLDIPNGIDPGFAFNAGEERLKALAKLALEKLKALPAELTEAALSGLSAADEAARAQYKAEVTKVQQELAAAIGKDQLMRSMSKAANRAAKWQIEEALAKNTPYLAKAINQIGKTQAGGAMSAPELLQAAKIQAAKFKDSAALANWKSAYINDKKLPASGQSVFDALPDDAQTAIVAQLDAQKAAIAAEKAAQAQLGKLAAGDLGKLEAQILGKLTPDPAFQALTAQAKVAKVLSDAASQKAKISQAIGISGYKKAIVANKTPTPAQKAAYDALSPEDQAKTLTEIEQELEKAYKAELAAQKAKQAQPELGAPPNLVSRPAEAINPLNLVKISDRKGSNPGGTYQDTTTGQRYYIKFPDDPEAVRNEALAHALYRLAGVEGPEFELIELQGKTAIASKIIDGLEADPNALRKGRIQGVQEHFAVDAWLANWDVIGQDYDNLKLLGGRGIRIDPGGSLRYRAQAGLKGSAFGDEVLELESLRNSVTNSQSASVFAHVTEADIEDGVRRILLVKEQAIRDAVERFGPTDVGAKSKLANTILARRNYLAKKYPHLKPQAPLPQPVGKISEVEQRDIEASRANGYTIKTDSDQIEDQHVVISTYTDFNGNKRTRAALKLRPNGAKRINVEDSAKLEPLDLSTIKSIGFDLLRGINARANRKEVIDAKTIERAETLREQIANFRRATRSADLYDSANLAKAGKAIDDLENMVEEYFQRVKSGDFAKPIAVFDFDDIPQNLARTPPKAKEGEVQWTRSKMQFPLARFEKGYMFETAQVHQPPGFDSVYDANVDGANVRWVPYDPENSFTSQGYMQIDLDGIGTAQSAKVFEVLDRLGIKSARADELDQVELYMEKIVALQTLRNSSLARMIAKTTKPDFPKPGLPEDVRRLAQVTAKIDLINAELGFDIRTSPRWNPYGKAQAFGHGRVLVDRPDISERDLERFEQAAVLYHNPEGYPIGATRSVWEKLKPIFEAGGQLASQLDRVRRGVPATGSSVASDYKSGGAAYVFTRIRLRGKQEKVAGVYFKPRMAFRADAITYDGDLYGQASREVQEMRRKNTVDEMIDSSDNESNETNFKNAVSLFDDLERIVFLTKQERDEAAAWLKANGYSTWPDGRSLEDVLDYLESSKSI